MKPFLQTILFGTAMMVCSISAFAQSHTNGVGEVSSMQEKLQQHFQRHQQLYSRYGQDLQMRTTDAREECGEIYSSSPNGYSCEACRQMRNDCQAIPQMENVAIIDGESRRELTDKENDLFGRAIGSIECKNPKTGARSVGTGVLVENNVVLTVAHNFYEERKGIYYKELDPVRDCKFVLRSHVTGERLETPIKIKAPVECPKFERVMKGGNCDWAVVKLDESATVERFHLPLQISNPAYLSEASVLAVGYHLGVEKNGHKLQPEIKLIDYGTVPKVPPSSEAGKYGNIFPYTLDTNHISSGEPIIAQVDGRFVVVGIHNGEYTFTPGVSGPFNGKTHFNYGHVINQDIYDQIQKMK